MEALVVLFLIIILILIIGVGNKLTGLRNDIMFLRSQLGQLKSSIDKVRDSESSPQTVKETVPKPQPIAFEAPPVIVPLVKPEEEVIDIPEPPPVALPEMKPMEKPQSIPSFTPAPLLDEMKPPSPILPKKKNNFEQFVGEKLASMVGITILVLGIFFMVKWAIDKKMISDAGKVIIGLASGSILILVAHKLAKNFRAFSSILVGGGIAVFYFSIYEAFQSYHILSQTPAFIGMILVTIAAIVLSVIYDKKELALIALIGGFCTPFLVSTGSGNYQVLFSYLLVLNIGIFCLAYFKKWPVVHIVGYALTVLIFGIWVVDTAPSLIRFQPRNGLLFATLFYLVFFGATIVYNLRKKQKFDRLDIALLLSNTALYFSAGYFFLLHIQEGKYHGVFSISLAVFNFMFAYRFYRSQSVDRNLVYLLIGLVLTFLSLTAPLQLHGNSITLFWACEFVLLYWLGIKSEIPLIKQTSILVVFLCIISLVLDWHHNYFSVQINPLPIIFNKAFIVGIVVLGAQFIKLHFLKSQPEDDLHWKLFTTQQYRNVLSILLFITLYFVGLFEIHYQVFVHTQNRDFQLSSDWMYHYSFLAALLYYSGSKKQSSLHFQKPMALISMISLSLYFVGNMSVYRLRNNHLQFNGLGLQYGIHYLLPLAALLLMVMLVKYEKNNPHQTRQSFMVMSWFLTTMLLVVFSLEAVHAWVVLSYQEGFSWYAHQIRAIKVALPILWTLVSLIIMVVGMRKKIKLFRIISLCIFSLTILKLFIYDMSNMGQGGKIAAFILLGVVLLLVSFMYQKIKGLFLDNEES